MSIHKNTPTTKLLSSLRHSGYDSIVAVNDVIDNSLDAGASKVSVVLRNESPGTSSTKVDDSFFTRISDNGIGMDKETLLEALKLGSETAHQDGDLGRFGMGLLTASISYGRQIEVLTCMKGGKHLRGVFDFDYIVDNREWGCEIEEMNDDQVEAFEKLCGKHGTVVTIRKIDRCSYTSIKTYVAHVMNSVGMAYFEKLSDPSHLEITVNDKKVRPVDPLELQLDGMKAVKFDDGAELVLDDCLRQEEMIEIDDDVSIGLSLVLLPKNMPLGNKGKEICNIALGGSTCGIYMVRAGRFISRESFRLVGRKPHNSHNRLRCVLRFGEDADAHMGIDFTKSRTVLSQSVMDKLKDVLGPMLKTAENVYNGQRTEEAKDDVAEEVRKAQDKVSETSSLHTFPPKTKKKRGPYAPREEKKPKEPKDKRVKVKGRTFLVRYATKMSSQANLLLFDAENGEVVLTWNTNHPFYVKYMEDSVFKGDGHKAHTVMEVMQFIGFSLATTSLAGATESLFSIPEDEFGMVTEHLVGKMSDTLRIVSQK